MRILKSLILVLIAFHSPACFSEDGSLMECDFFANEKIDSLAIKLRLTFSEYLGLRGTFLSLEEEDSRPLEKEMIRDLQILGVSTSDRPVSKFNFHSYHSFQFPWYLEGDLEKDNTALEISNWSGRPFWSRYHQVKNEKLNVFFEDFLKSKLGRLLDVKISKGLKLTQAGHWQLHQAIGQFRTFIKQVKVYMQFTNDDLNQVTHVFARLISERFNSDDLKQKRAFKIVGPDAPDSRDYHFFLVCRSVGNKK
jgi:hypothetical protein